jgi:hypothetical protein
MAITPAACQTQLGTNQGDPQIMRADELVGSTLQGWLVQGGAYAPGRTVACTTTRSDSAATQAAAIKTALRA